ncbi:unnamed protein product, partial [Didymodactylos carnosus]
HINHIKEKAGIKHVGIGADYDGVLILPEGLGDVSTYPALLEALMENGWSEDDIVSLIGGNILRVLQKNEEKAAELQAKMSEQDDLIPRIDLEKYNLTKCRTLDMYT